MKSPSLKKSPKRDTIFQKFRDDVTIGSEPGIRILCPTRWTVRAEALASIVENYQALHLTWCAAKDATRDTEMRVRIGGVAAQMEKFDFYYGITLGRKLHNIVDNVSRSLQARDISACDGQKLVNMMKTKLQSMRTDECFGSFWEYLEHRRSSVDVSSPTLSRRKKVPRRFEIGEIEPEHPKTVQENYGRIYFEAIDLLVETLINRFQQKGFEMMQKLEIVLTSVQQPHLSEAIKDVVEFYGANFGHPDCLQTQMNVLHTSTEKSLTDLESIVTHLKSLGIAEKVVLRKSRLFL